MKYTLLISILFILGACKHEQPAPLIPLEAFFQNPQLSDFQISPDGKSISYLAPYKTRMNVFVRPIDDTVSVRITSVDDRDIRFYSWKSSSHIVYLKDAGGDEDYHLYSASFNGSEERDLTPYDSSRVKILDALEDNDSLMLIEMNLRRKDVYDVYRLNVETAELTMLAENPGNVTSWFTDHNQMIRLAMVTDGVNQTVLFRESINLPWDTVKQTSFKDIFTPLLFTFDNEEVYMLSNIGRDKAAVVTFNPITKTETSVLYENDIADAGRLEFTLKAKRPTAVVYSTDKMKRHYLDDSTAWLYDSLENKFDDVLVTIVSNSRTEDIYILKYTSDRISGKYYTYFRSKDSLAFLGNVLPDINEDHLASVEPISFYSKDSLQIHGYLTYPKGVERKNLPLIVLPHGGPWWRDFWEFNPRVQFLANRGYAVLQVNYRGSISYGRTFWQSSFKQWGKSMQDDITAGVEYAIAQGIADPARICIMGGSYGGYAVLAGLAFTPDLYRCGVDIVGVSNLFTLLGSIPEYWKPYLEMLYEQIGHPVTDSVLLHDASPVFHADNITAPLLIFQGANDPRVKKAESDQMVEALQKRGVKVPYIVKENEGHGFNNEENRLEMYRIIESFLKENL